MCRVVYAGLCKNRARKEKGVSIPPNLVATKPREGYTHGQWVLVDYGDVIIHIFYEPVRLFYDLERLWFQARRCELPEPYHTQAQYLSTGTEGS